MTYSPNNLQEENIGKVQKMTPGNMKTSRFE